MCLRRRSASLPGSFTLRSLLKTSESVRDLAAALLQVDGFHDVHLTLESGVPREEFADNDIVLVAARPPAVRPLPIYCL